MPSLAPPAESGRERAGSDRRAESMWVLAGLLMAFLLTALTPGKAPLAATRPELPRVTVDTTFSPPTGNRIPVPAGGSFQAVLNAAQPGDTIVLQAGATYAGPFTLPSKPDSRWIYIQSSNSAALPPPGSRVGPEHSANMPKVVSASPPYAITVSPGAHHFRFVGIEIGPSPRKSLGTVVALGLGNEVSASQLPHHIVIDRCFIHGDPVVGASKGIAIHGNHIAVIDSYLSDFKDAGAEANALWGSNGAGPIKIVNNYLEGAGENVMFGGAEPRIPDQLPSDIEIRRNHFSKPFSWKQGHPSYAGTPWLVKNLIEFKLGRRVLIDGNVFENSWPHAQAGYAVMITPRNENGGAPWSAVQDLTFTNNIVRRTASGMAISGRDGRHPSQHTQRVLIANNLFEDIGGSIGGDGRLFLLTNGIADLSIERNTAFQTGPFLAADGLPPQVGFLYRNNITPNGSYGVWGSGVGVGDAALRTYFPGAVFTRNVIFGPWPSSGGVTPSHYAGQPENFFPAGINQVGFVNQAAGDYRLSLASPYRKAAGGGKDLGADIDAIRLVTAGVVSKGRAE